MTSKDPAAPHGYDGEGNPLAPYGLKVDGTPKLSRRGAQPGQSGNGNRTAEKRRPQLTSNATDAKRKQMLIDLTGQLVEIPLLAVSAAPPARKRLGRHAEALAGDAVIVHALAPSLADAMIMAAGARPGMLAWMDTVEKKAPFLMLAQVGIAMTKAIVSHHLNPDPELNAAGAKLMDLKGRQMIAVIEAEAREMGIDPETLAQAA